MGAERLSSEVGFAKTVKQNLIGRKASERAEMPGSIFQMQVWKHSITSSTDSNVRTFFGDT